MYKRYSGVSLIKLLGKVYGMRNLHKVTLLLCIPAVFACSQNNEPIDASRKNDFSSKPLPVVVVGLGDSMQKVREKSSYKHSQPDDEFSWAYFTDDPVKFIYSTGSTQFELAEVRYLKVATQFDHVVHIELGPLLEYVQAEDLEHATRNIIEILEIAGWMKDSKLPSSDVSKLIARLEAKSRAIGRAQVGVWRNGDDKISLQMMLAHNPSRAISKSLGYDQKQYLILLVIDNKKVMDRWKKEALKARAKKLTNDRKS